MKLTRRQLATLLASSTALAQAPPPVPATPGEELKNARDRAKANGEALARLAIPMATEPAFQFKA
ncbi:MAG: hypothetical protein LAP87_27415 [Acidobacteriia bacterium]|nr:hypothetical protein [Terriglobia bacterium]